MAGETLTRQSVASLAQAMQSGHLSSKELVRACLAEIGANDARLHAFVEVYHAEAIEKAETLDAERHAGGCRGPLHGIPIAVKDLADLFGRVTSFGSRSYSDAPAEGTAAFIQALEQAGAIILGKTHTVEFAFGSWGTNHVRGTPVNPAVEGHATPGGSSSGSAVAVAAGMVPAAIGTDTGGSVRIPAALCGIVGMKPSHGSISLAGVAPLSPTLDTVGPLVNCIEDARLLLQPMAEDVVAEDLTMENTVYRRLDRKALEPLDPNVFELYERALARMATTGARIELLEMPSSLAEYQARCGAIMAYDAYKQLMPIIEDYRRPVDPFVRRRIALGRDTTAEEYAAMRARRTTDQAQFQAVFGPRDILVLPTTPLPAQQLTSIDENALPMSRYTRLANYLDMCAVSVPFHQGAATPAGLQLVGNKGSDLTVLAHAARWMEGPVR